MELHERLIVDWMQQPLKTWRWKPPPVPAFAGPAELAKVLVSYRARLEEIRAETGRNVEAIGSISNEGLEKLLLYAYRASFRSDEGRPVRGCLFVASDSQGRPESDSTLSKLANYFVQQAREYWERRTHIHRLDQPRPLNDSKLLARLAPTLQAEDATLIVREENGEPSVTAIAFLDYDDVEHQLYDMPRRREYGYQGLAVEILGAGHLQVSEGRGEYTLFANELLVLGEVDLVEPVRLWLHDVSRSLADSAKQDPGWDSQVIKLHELDPSIDYKLPHVDVGMRWSSVLREAEEIAACKASYTGKFLAKLLGK
jgi:hypothetical protein